MKKFYLFLLVAFFSAHRLQAQDLSTHIKVLNQIILPYMDQEEISGISLALYAEGKGIIISYGNADRQSNKPVTSNTIFELASVTKVFTTTDLALKVLQGKIKLSDPISKYIPELKFSSQLDKMTLLRLATHTSSLPRTMPRKDDSYDLESVLVFLKDWSPEKPVGSNYSYSNLGMGLLGLALEKMDKKSFEEIMRKDILIPLRMSSTSTEIPEELLNFYAQGYTRQGKPIDNIVRNILPASVSLKSTGADMLRFLEANLGIGKNQDLIKAMKFAQRDFFEVNANLTMGLGWQKIKINGTLAIDKNGGVPGFSSYIGIIPEKNLGIVILANKAKIHSTQFGRLILKRLLEIEPALNNSPLNQ